MLFHENIRALREDMDLNQIELGKKLNWSQRKVSRLETKSSEPTPDEIIKICHFFNVSADYILGLTDIKKELPKK